MDTLLMAPPTMRGTGTAAKAAKLAALRIQIDAQNTVVAQAAAKSSSLQKKLAATRAAQTAAQGKLSSAQSLYDQWLKIQADVNSSENASSTSSMVSQNTYGLAKNMLKAWEYVARLTLQTVDEVEAVAEYIQKRKAANPLINNDLVTESVAANRNAEATMAKVTAALTSAMEALTSSSEASRSTDLTLLYAELAKNYAEGVEDAITEKEDGATGAAAPETHEESLKVLLTDNLDHARSNAVAYDRAVTHVNEQNAQALKEHSQATEQLTALQAALAAAEAAVATA
ncbi:MAG: hypothetical protein AAFQ98_21700 [Bacteroidota bacterium]